MIRAYYIGFVSACTFGVFCGACASPPASPITHTVRHIPDGDRATVWVAAQSALVGLGYAIDEVDDREGLITARPVIPGKRDESTVGGGRLTSRGETRRVAHLRVAEGGGGVKIYCKVVIQKQTTEAYRMLERDRRASDVPGDTPIERDAATTPAQNTVWETVRRDTAAERLILQTILEQAGGSPG